MTNDVITPTLLLEVPAELQPFVSTVQPTAIGELGYRPQLTIAQTIMEDAAAYAEEEEMMYQEQEFVHDAEWGAEKEAPADDEEDNTME